MALPPLWQRGFLQRLVMTAHHHSSRKSAPRDSVQNSAAVPSRRVAFARTARRFPLDRPQPLPAWASPMVRLVVGRPVLMRSGAKTARALAAAGSPAAADEGIVHLAAPLRRTPASLAVLAHELSHVAEGDKRPRFLFDDLLDEGERRARGVESAVRSAAGSYLGNRLSGLSSAVGDTARSGLGAAGMGNALSPGGALAGIRSAVRDSLGGLMDRGVSEVVGAVPSASQVIAGGGSPAALGRDLLSRARPSGWPTGAAALEAIGDTARVARGLSPSTVQAGPLADSVASLVPGGVGSLPVGGLGGAARGLMDRANVVVNEASAGGIGEATSFAENAMADVHEGIGAAPSGAEGLLSLGEGSLENAAEQFGGGVERAQATLGSLVGGTATAATDAFSQMSEFIEVLEERLLAELERRGGRFGGMF
jgi:hypothetical protein